MLGAAALAARGQSGAEIPKRPLGRTGLEVSALGIGGYHLGSVDSDAEATQIVNEALDAGVNFFDNAWEYHQGLSEERLGRALKGKRDRAVVMTKVCTHGRDKNVAMRQLEESLTRLQTDHLDVWQIHEVIYENDPDLIFAPNGAAEALLEAKQQGKVRFLGFTGHKDPSIHLKMLSHNFPFDTVQMPLNCLDATFRSFETNVLPEVNRRGIAALGMKSLGGSGELVREGAVCHHGTALCDEPAGRGDHQRHRFPERAASESRGRARLSTFQCRRDANHPRRVPIGCLGRAHGALQDDQEI